MKLPVRLLELVRVGSGGASIILAMQCQPASSAHGLQPQPVEPAATDAPAAATAAPRAPTVAPTDPTPVATGESSPAGAHAIAALNLAKRAQRAAARRAAAAASARIASMPAYIYCGMG